MDRNSLPFSVRTAALTTAAFGLLLGLSSVTQGSPLFSIGDGGDRTWNQAISDGNVVAATSLTQVAQDFYAQQVAGDPDHNSFALVQPNLVPLDNLQDVNGTDFDSLVMEWDDAGPDTLGIAAWDYVYDVDPDLTGTRIDFSLLAPPGIWDISLELIDELGGSRGWFIPATGIGPVATGIWGNFTILPDLAAAQGPFTAFGETPGFDITRVIAIRLDEAGNSVTLPNPVGTLPAWNAWDSLRVSQVPEPGTAALMALGLLGLGGLARRR